MCTDEFSGTAAGRELAEFTLSKEKYCRKIKIGIALENDGCSKGCLDEAGGDIYVFQTTAESLLSSSSSSSNSNNNNENNDNKVWSS